MQFPQSPKHSQLPLFDAFLPSPMAPLLNSNGQTPWLEETATCSELTLRGSTGHCLNLLAPILRELSQNQDARWLTLIAPPSSLTQTWLRNAGLSPAPRPQPYRDQLAAAAGCQHPATIGQRGTSRWGAKPEYQPGLKPASFSL